MTSSTKPLIAFLGATGGCALSALVLTLKAGYPAIALARTPSKLTDLLTKQHAISEAAISSSLEIIAGSSTDISAVKSFLSRNPSLIIWGLGPSPKLQFSFTAPVTTDQPSICADSSAVLLTALHELEQESKLTTKPFLATVSTTGISKRRDVPWLLMPLYHILLKIPHIDKRKMEDSSVAEVLKSDSVLSGYTTIRASLLTDGAATKNVRMGWERHESDVDAEAGPGPAIGYIISRANVGNWMFENLVENQSSEWNRRMVTITQ